MSNSLRFILSRPLPPRFDFELASPVRHLILEDEEVTSELLGEGFPKTASQKSSAISSAINGVTGVLVVILYLVYLVIFDKEGGGDRPYCKRFMISWKPSHIIASSVFSLLAVLRMITKKYYPNRGNTDNEFKNGGRHKYKILCEMKIILYVFVSIFHGDYPLIFVLSVALFVESLVEGWNKSYRVKFTMLLCYLGSFYPECVYQLAYIDKLRGKEGVYSTKQVTNIAITYVVTAMASLTGQDSKSYFTGFIFIIIWVFTGRSKMMEIAYGNESNLSDLSQALNVTFLWHLTMIYVFTCLHQGTFGAGKLLIKMISHLVIRQKFCCPVSRSFRYSKLGIMEKGRGGEVFETSKEEFFRFLETKVDSEPQNEYKLLGRMKKSFLIPENESRGLFVKKSDTSENLVDVRVKNIFECNEFKNVDKESVFLLYFSVTKGVPIIDELNDIGPIYFGHCKRLKNVVYSLGDYEIKMLDKPSFTAAWKVILNRKNKEVNDSIGVLNRDLLFKTLIMTKIAFGQFNLIASLLLISGSREKMLRNLYGNRFSKVLYGAYTALKGGQTNFKLSDKIKLGIKDLSHLEIVKETEKRIEGAFIITDGHNEWGEKEIEGSEEIYLKREFKDEDKNDNNKGNDSKEGKSKEPLKDQKGGPEIDSSENDSGSNNENSGIINEFVNMAHCLISSVEGIKEKFSPVSKERIEKLQAISDSIFPDPFEIGPSVNRKKEWKRVKSIQDYNENLDTVKLESRNLAIEVAGEPSKIGSVKFYCDPEFQETFSPLEKCIVNNMFGLHHLDPKSQKKKGKNLPEKVNIQEKFVKSFLLRDSEEILKRKNNEINPYPNVIITDLMKVSKYRIYNFLNDFKDKQKDVSDHCRKFMERYSLEELNRVAIGGNLKSETEKEEIKWVEGLVKGFSLNQNKPTETRGSVPLMEKIKEIESKGVSEIAVSIKSKKKKKVNKIPGCSEFNMRKGKAKNTDNTRLKKIRSNLIVFTRIISCSLKDEKMTFGGNCFLVNEHKGKPRKISLNEIKSSKYMKLKSFVKPYKLLKSKIYKKNDSSQNNKKEKAISAQEKGKIAEEIMKIIPEDLSKKLREICEYLKADEKTVMQKLLNKMECFILMKEISELAMGSI